MRLMSYIIETDRGWLELKETKTKIWVELTIINEIGEKTVCKLDKEGFDELTRLSYDIFLEDPPEPEEVFKPEED